MTDNDQRKAFVDDLPEAVVHTPGNVVAAVVSFLIPIMTLAFFLNLSLRGAYWGVGTPTFVFLVYLPTFLGFVLSLKGCVTDDKVIRRVYYACSAFVSAAVPFVGSLIKVLTQL